MELLGSVMIPAMKKEGYGAAFARAVRASSSTVGPIIPLQRIHDHRRDADRPIRKLSVRRALVVCLFVAAGIGKVSIGAVSRAGLPFLLVSLLVLALVTLIPDLSLFLPRLFMD